MWMNGQITSDPSFLYLDNLYLLLNRLILMKEQLPRLLMIMETYLKKTLSRLLKTTNCLILAMLWVGMV